LATPPKVKGTAPCCVALSVRIVVPST
jgi:hypothetical protein